MLTSSGNPQDMDMLTSVNMDILRGEMKLRLAPPPPRREGDKEEEDDVPKSRLAQLEKNLEVQLEEEEKWDDLTLKLEKKSKQMADLVIRLDTSVKVFQHELVKRNRSVVDAEEQLQDKIQDQQRVLEKIRQDKESQLLQANKSEDKSEDAEEELMEKEQQYLTLTNRLRNIRSGLVPLEERVQNLQINLIGNSGMSDSQQIYYNADLQVERDHRDRVLTQIEDCQQEMETLSKAISTLKGRRSLFRDEHLRRLQKAKTLDLEIQEQEKLFQTKLQKYQAEVDTIRQDRDAWEDKTTKLVQDLDDKRIEATKLTVKSRLFKSQLEGVQATVKRLKSMIEASQNMSGTSINVDDESDDEDGDDIPEPVNEEEEEEDKPYVWKPPQRDDPTGTSSWMTTTKSKKPSPPPPVVSKTAPKYVPPSTVVKPVYYPPSQPMVKVNHIKVQMGSTNTTVEPSSSVAGKPYSGGTMMGGSSKNQNQESLLAAQLQDVQRDLEHQKRFQKEHALKMEAQFARLASKVEVLANHGTDSAAERVHQTSMDSQLNALKTQMQKDAMRDNQEMRQLLQQLSQQCSTLSNKLDGMTQTIQRRDQENARMEQRMKEKETKYQNEMEALRGEMDRQLDRQQQLFSDKMSQAMIQMEKLYGATQPPTDHDSAASLESLVPMDSSSRATSLSSVHDHHLKEDIKAAAPTTHVRSSSFGYSMVASEVLKNGPWF